MTKSMVGMEGRQSVAESPSEAGRPRLHRPNVNLTATERSARMVIGVAGIAAGLALLVSAGSMLAVVLEVLLVLAGLDLLVTGALGHCPLYQKLGHVPRSLRESR